MFTTADIAKVRKLIRSARLKGKKVGFVPTMGALHQGHLSLVKACRKDCGFVVVSIFVNPLQFGPKEDLKKYPRNLGADKTLLQKAKVDLLFYPDSRLIYPDNFSTFVEEKDLSQPLCGKYRPGHFRGVATVVAKLFNIVQPDIAYFGSKDYQQAEVIRRLIRDLNFPIALKVLPIIREKNGLALSSRNSYLTFAQRNQAAIIYQVLKAAKASIKAGEKNPGKIIRLMRDKLSTVKTLKIEYLEIVDTQSLRKLETIKGKVLIALAVYLAKVRLIDNITVYAK